MTQAEVAELLRYKATRSVMDAVRYGSLDLTPIRVGGRLLFSRDEVDRVIEEGKSSG